MHTFDCKTAVFDIDAYQLEKYLPTAKWAASAILLTLKACVITARKKFTSHLTEPTGAKISYPNPEVI